MGAADVDLKRLFTNRVEIAAYAEGHFGLEFRKMF
jgi:hypothetical protein